MRLYEKQLHKRPQANLAQITQKIINSGFSLFTLKTLVDILEIRKESTYFDVMKRLINSGVLEKIERNKYILTNVEISDFKLASFLYVQSYVSFETALNFYGILSQFPYEITSATPRKTIKKLFKGKIFSYTHIKKELFWGYEKKEDFFIAIPEKALLDQLYISSRGYKKINLAEYDLSLMDFKKIKKYLKFYPSSRQFNKNVKLLYQYL